MEQPDVRLERVTKKFGEVVAVDDLSLSFDRGGFVALLGPSGCGKTTTLRMIGGFEEPTAGTVYLGEQDVTGLPPYRREVNTVFQNYALFPHMSIFDNVAFGLRQKRVSKHEVARRVPEMLDLVELTGFEKRKPTQLSGGQAQRVALARALVNRPKVLLLDEPLGALDLKLREEMQVELKHIQQQVGITFIFVTHDQGEALSMSDRVAVFNEGKVEQVGPPRQIYEHPATEFVAGFVGTANLLADGDGLATVRPERIRFGTPTGDEIGTAGTVDAVSYLGSTTRYRVQTDDGTALVVEVPNTTAGLGVTEGDAVQLAWHPTDRQRVGASATDTSEAT